jgi:error-prone DNA polymerase
MSMFPAYIELHCHSYYSLLGGASSPEELVEYAATLGYPALALTDHNGLYGAVRFWHAAQERGIKPLIGAEICLAGGHSLTLLAETQKGYGNVCRLISAGQLARPDRPPVDGLRGVRLLGLTVQDLAPYTEGLLCLSGGRQGAVTSALLDRDTERARQAAVQLRVIWEGRFWIELQRHSLPSDVRLNAALLDLAHELGIEVVATNDVHYARREGQCLYDVLTCVRHHVTLPEALASGLLHPNSERCLKSPDEMAALFTDLPQALYNTVCIAERCKVRLDFSAQRLPAFSLPQGHTAASHLRALAEQGLVDRFSPITPRARAQLNHELAVIERVGLCGYFLVVWDIVRFARERGIRCQGRGSAANSLVAYLLGITPVDPLAHNLLFERFLSEDTRTMPDIDVDFAADRREEVIQYVYERYGESHVGMVCNTVTYRTRSALRDVAKALAFPPDVIDRAAKVLDTHSVEVAATTLEAALAQACSAGEDDLPWDVLARVLGQMDGIPRHLSIHAGGMLITAAPLVEIVPLERAATPDRVIVQWDKDSIEDAGLIKIDLLCLRTLGAVEEAVTHIREHWSVQLDLERLPLDEPAVYEMLQRADTIGCFQVESRAQAQMLPRLWPTCFEDLVIEVALVRPGPIQGNMVHPYLNRRQGLEPVRYPHPSLQPALEETLGVMVFQEQVIRVAQAIAGFSPGQADALRRAISRNRSDAAMAALCERFLTGALANGIDPVVAREIWGYLDAFSGYGFCKSHAAAFALVAYQTLYLKAYYPAAFYCALLNHQPMGFYSPDVLIGDARRHGVSVLYPDVNHSQEACALEAHGASLAVRLGLRYVHGLGETRRTHVVERRGDRPFSSLQDFCRRTRLPKPVVENLIRAGAMEGLNRRTDHTRRDLLWELGGLIYQEEGLDLEAPVAPVDLPVLDQIERMLWEYELMGLTPGEHIMGIYRARLRARGVLSSGELASRRSGEWVLVAGLVIVRQRPPSAKGFVFFTLEDEEGLVNLVVQPKVYERYRDVLRNSPLLLVEGQLQRERGAVNIQVRQAAPLCWQANKSSRSPVRACLW